MRHIIMSDMHAPLFIDKAYNYLKEFLTKNSVDQIVINGDLLGIFSISSSNQYKDQRIPQNILMQHLKSAAPIFYEQFIKTKTVTRDMISDYVLERYNWCYETIKHFSELKYTIFNMGNHESPLHFLVLNEISFLTGCSSNIANSFDKEKLKPIYDDFEKRLIGLESSGNFKYIRNDVLVIDNTLILGIPGESHDTAGQDYYSLKQEEKTKLLIEKAKSKLPFVFNIIIYNHTQGRYEKSNGQFFCNSKSLNEFMDDLPISIFNKIFVQSHNHWSYTQFQKNNDFYYVLNNAGLHKGIFNLLDIHKGGIDCYDLDPDKRKISKVKLSTNHPITPEKNKVIERHYDDVNYVLNR